MTCETKCEYEKQSCWKYEKLEPNNLAMEKFNKWKKQ